MRSLLQSMTVVFLPIRQPLLACPLLPWAGRLMTECLSRWAVLPHRGSELGREYCVVRRGPDSSQLWRKVLESGHPIA
jgi:hypothetical protein